MSAGAVTYVVASDVADRDGVGLEVCVDDVPVLEIFRDDTLRRTTVTLLAADVDLAVMEAAIARFRQAVGTDYLVYPDDPAPGGNDDGDGA